jgi:hypothetical protein
MTDQGNSRPDGAVMTEEIDKAAERAGFKPMSNNSSVRAIFTQGSSALIVYGDGRWRFYVEVCNRPDYFGDDFKSLQLFLDMFGL